MTKLTTGEQAREPSVAMTIDETASGAASSSEQLHKRVLSSAFGLSIRTQISGTTTTKKKPVYTIVKTRLLIPGDGAPLADAALVVEDRLIAWVGSQSSLPAKYTDNDHHRVFTVPYLTPGLWDVHVHFDGAPENAERYMALYGEPPASAGARLARGCWETLQRGYTSVRDLAGHGCELARAIDDGSIVGPNVYSSGACLSQTAGHGDLFDLPAGDVLLNLGVANIQPGHYGSVSGVLVDGVDECRRAVRLQIRRGARCIKVMATGGVLSLNDNPLYAQFSKAELEVIVEEAARQGRSVAAHVHGKPGIIAALKAGVATVEHVSFADDECIDLIKEKGAVYVATRTISDLLLKTGGEGIPEKIWEKAKLCCSRNEVSYKAAIKAGIPCALGTDTPPGFNMAMELEYAVKAGMSSLEAIKAATANGPLTLGEQAPKSGQLRVGYEADFLGLTANPVEDVKVLQDKETIKWVWKGGRMFKGPGVGPWGEVAP